MSDFVEILVAKLYSNNGTKSMICECSREVRIEGLRDTCTVGKGVNMCELLELSYYKIARYQVPERPYRLSARRKGADH